MKLKLLAAFGAVLIIVSSVTPLAYIDGKAVSLLPLFNDPEILGTSWSWRDIAVFGISIPLIAVIMLYLIFKVNKFAVKIMVNLILVLILLVAAAIWMASTKNPGIDINIGSGVFIFAAGYIVTLLFIRKII